MRMVTLLVVGFERWGGLRPALKTDGKGRKWIPLFRGIWRRARNRVKCPPCDVVEFDWRHDIGAAANEYGATLKAHREGTEY